MSDHESLGERMAGARRGLAQAGIDALLVTPGADLRYLTGYHALPLERLTCLVLPAKGGPRLVVPALEEPAAHASPISRLGVQIVPWQEAEDPVALVASLLGNASTIALDDHMWAEKVLAFRAAIPQAQQVLAGPVLRHLRMRKSTAEIQALRSAGAAIDRVHARMAQWLRIGRTEREVGRDIADAIITEGHERVDFVIVASGPNGASPHAEVTDRVLEAGDTVVVDIGGTTEAGYCSDETRTYCLGNPPTEVTDFYAVLLRAQLAACAHARPGVTAESVDAAARDVIAAAGYGEAFLHRTGHGIGLETHEEPYIVAGNSTVLEPGMAFSIEPGIYLAGRHGARIEDIVVVADDGIERLNLRPRELAVLST
ncbi:MAG TPA: Xaa-Pro peptidase family protein [Dermatophilaceae bacterium]|nr:Xaa-Pro peptidase family protein [Dermatophilaceae bacterium]